MEKIKELLQNKLFKMLALVIAGLIVVIVIIVIVMAMMGRRVSNYADLEDKMISAAKEYYKKNNDRLPKEIGAKIEIDSSSLAEDGYMKELEKIAPKDATCTGKVTVKNVNQGYFYQAFLDCGEKYKTTKLSDYINNHENPVIVGPGLYEVNGKKAYRGENPKNYITFAGRTYRIVQINEDGTVDIIGTTREDRVVWDDRYNEDRNQNEGINDYSVSRVRDTLLTYVNSDAFNDNQRSMLEPFSLCVGKVSEDALVTRGMECSEKLDNQIIGLLPVSYYTYASLDANCTTATHGTCENYNYLVIDYQWWTLTADSNTSYRVYAVGPSSSAILTRGSSMGSIREVLRLTENTVYVKGDGSLENPYVIK